MNVMQACLLYHNLDHRKSGESIGVGVRYDAFHQVKVGYISSPPCVKKTLLPATLSNTVIQLSKVKKKSSDTDATPTALKLRIANP